MKLSRPAVVAIAVAALIGGVVAADAATTSSPVKLCSNTKTRVVEVPNRGTCAKGTTSFSVASQADVAALAARADSADALDSIQGSRLDALKATNDAQAAQIDSLQRQVLALTPGLDFSGFRIYNVVAGQRFYETSIAGHMMKPGSAVSLRFPSEPDLLFDLDKVSADGTYSTTISFTACERGPFVVEWTNIYGIPVSTNQDVPDICR